MSEIKSSFWEAFQSRDDLELFGVDALLLFALQLRFNIDDITSLASNSLTEGKDDKKADLVHIDSEAGYAVIAQTYISKDMHKKEAKANKANDLNTAITWLLSRSISKLPLRLKSHAEELRQALNDNSIKFLHIWYVHNLPESENVKNALKGVEDAAYSAIRTHFSNINDIEIQALEVGTTVLNEWYKSILNPILVTEENTISIPKGLSIKGPDWKAYVTTIKAKWLYQQFKKHKTDLFSANVREYLGSRGSDKNINNGIKQTAQDNPGHFWIYNNGITALVHEFKEIKHDNHIKLYFKGISIINGAQTVGAIGSLEKEPSDETNIQIRFVTCTNMTRLRDIVKYNNSQNKIMPADFRSGDPAQTRLIDEFNNINIIEYSPRRGGAEDRIKRPSNTLSSVTAGQALAALHGSPNVAYHQKTLMWEEEKLYNTYFGQQTTAKHIIFAYTLLKAAENKKLDLRKKDKDNRLIDIEKEQLDFFRLRGSTFLMVAAIANCLEIILNKPIPNLFNTSFKDNSSIEQKIKLWAPIMEAASGFTRPLANGLSDGFKAHETVQEAIRTFRGQIGATRQANNEIYATFANHIDS